jgi:hypothetical protein
VRDTLRVLISMEMQLMNANALLMAQRIELALLVKQAKRQ